MKRMLGAFGVILLVSVAGCTFQAQECCDCMGTKETILGGDCLNDSFDQCVEDLSQNPPEDDAISAWCRNEENGFCQESCADILYRK